jgi:hypothetical protein
MTSRGTLTMLDAKSPTTAEIPEARIGSIKGCFLLDLEVVRGLRRMDFVSSYDESLRPP